MPLTPTVIARAARGDPASCHALVEAHGPLVFGMCRRLCHDPEDAYQEIWEKVLGALGRFDPAGPAPLRGWIAIIARRHLIDRHRRVTVRGEVVPLDGVPACGPDLDQHADHQRLRARLEVALRRLPPEQRAMVVQHHIHGVELETLAADAGIALGTVKSRLHRGRARLAQILRSPR